MTDADLKPAQPAPEPKPRFGSLVPRVITGLILAAAAVCLVLLVPIWIVILTAGLGGFIGMAEYTAMRRPGDWGPASAASILLAGAVVASALAGPAAVAASLLMALALMAAVCMAGKGEPARRLRELQTRLWGIFYVGGLLACLVLVISLPQGRLLILLLLIAVAAADTGAYFCGNFLGRTKMAPELSPGKTLEGLAGGLLLAAALGAGYSALFLEDTGAGLGAVLSLVMAGFSVLGDLLESVIKRAAGVKDSGRILPGHGGLLDRLDGIMMAGPVLLLARVLWWQ